MRTSPAPARWRGTEDASRATFAAQLLDSASASAKTGGLRQLELPILKPSDQPSGSFALAIVLLVTLAALWASSYSLIHLIVASIPPVTATGVRVLMAGTLLLLVMRVRGAVMPRDSRMWRAFTVQAVLGSIIPLTLIAWAQTAVEVNVAVILSSTSPIFTFFLTWAITRHEPATARKLFGVVAGMTGICLIVGMNALGGIGRDFLAQLALLGASLSYSCGAIFGRKFDGLDSIVPAAATLLIASCLLLPVGLVLERPWTSTPSATSLAALVALAVFSTALAHIIYFWLLRTVGSIGVTSQSYVRIPLGVLFGMVLFGEMLASSTWLGLAFVVAGVVAMTWPTRRPKDAAVPAA